MYAFVSAAGERVKNELAVEMRIQNAVNGVVQKPVAHAGFVNIARFGIIDFEGMILAVPIGFIPKFPMKRQNIVR